MDREITGKNLMEEFAEKYKEDIEAINDQQMHKDMMEYHEIDSEEALNQEVPHDYETLGASEITEENIMEWKLQFPKSKIFSITLNDELFIIRTINRVEYKAIATRPELNSYTREEVIAKTCVLYPQLDSRIIGEGDAGIVGTLSQYILRTSGFIEPDDIMRLA